MGRSALRPAWYGLVSVAILGFLRLAAVGHSDLQVSSNPKQLIGHPRNRFPLKVYADYGDSVALQLPLQDAVAEWNQVIAQNLRIKGFVWTNSTKSADVLIKFARHQTVRHEMGETDIDADRYGVIKLPVKITLMLPKARGHIGARQMLFEVAVHELGHALGLPHINQPDSIMCCDQDAIDFSNPTTRAAYIQARRHPNLDSLGSALAIHYEQFWNAQYQIRRP